MWWVWGTGNAAYYVAIEAAVDTAHSLSWLTGVTTVQMNDYSYFVCF